MRSLSRDLDLFDPPPRPRPELIAKELYPPLPLAGKTLVWGFALLDAAERLGAMEFNCVPLDTTDRIKLLGIALSLENRTGAFSRPEQARLLQYLEEAGALERLPEIMPLIAAEAPALWRAAVAAYRESGPAARRLLDDGLLDQKTALRARSLPEEYFTALERDRARFTYSERRLLTLALWEISRRDELDEAGTRSLCREILSAEDPWPLLRGRRSPELSRLLDRFVEITAGLRQSGVSAEPPVNFEGEEITFRFTAASQAIYRKRLAALEEFEARIDRLFDLL